jgi:allophanate hydrolase subunit 1
MRVLVVVTAIAAALAIVPTASPGGWATVGFDAGIAALVVLIGGFVVMAARRSRRLTPARD